MSLKRVVSIADLRELAKRRVPRVVFDLLDGAAQDELVLRKSVERLRAHTFIPRVLKGAAKRDQTTVLFGKSYASFFGIAPTGTISIIRRDVELILAEAAAASGIPQILSGGSAHPLETVCASAPGTVWSQLYAANDPDITADLVKRAADAGASALVWTVDLSVPSKNDRLIRNGFGIPPRLTLGARLEALTHPAWMREYLGGGMIHLDNWRRYVGADASAFEVHQFFLSHRQETQTWREMETLRRLWKGPLIVKGILHPADAVQAADLGADGVIVSNHGGYGLDRTPASIDMLPAVVAAVGHRITVMFDSGIRRGADAVIALCLGAKFVFVGRATLYGAAAARVEGARKAIDILKDEIDRTMGSIGAGTPADFSAACVRRPDEAIWP